MKVYTYLALGDSYTIGEQAGITKSFPYQAVQLLRKAGLNFHAPEIIATTGWTTDQLKMAIDENILLTIYDFVTLLIGVNNQYQGRSADEFRQHFRYMLELAIERTGGNAANVIVLSIPDWSVTPFAAEKNRDRIRSEIEMYNFICQAEAEHFQASFIDITTAQRDDGSVDEYLATDKLHPSGKEYLKWAKKLSARMVTLIEGTNNF